MMRGFVKSDEGILKFYFCAMAALFYSRRGRENLQIDLSYSPIHNIIIMVIFTPPTSMADGGGGGGGKYYHDNDGGEGVC